MDQIKPEILINPLLKPATFKKPFYLVFKRFFDIVVAFTALAILSPLLFTVALLIKLTSKGPVFFFQDRVGKHGRVFKFIKFRSMVQEAEKFLDELKLQNEHKDSYTFKMKKDPRVTGIGRIIRKLSIDELPQLWLVLMGEMSLVGPRPAITSEVDQYNRVERQRLAVKPGLTCIWQVSGRGDIPFQEQLKMDINYINERSFIMDLKLLFLTIPAVLSGRGAY